jgi:hypothetical protein
VAYVALALDDVGLAVPLQELLEAAGHRVLWSPPLADGPAHLPPDTEVDVVVLAERRGKPYGEGLEKWRDQALPPGILAVVLSAEGQTAAAGERVPFIAASAAPADVAASVTRALSVRWSGRLAASYARGHLGLSAEEDPAVDAAQVVRAARSRSDLEVVREALRWYALHYVATTPLIAKLRELRALEIPEVESLRLMDGTRTAQTVVRTAPVGPAQAGRLLWALACIGGLTLTSEPPDRSSHERRHLAMARAHLRARHARAAHATCYDLLEVTPAAGVPEIEQAVEMLAIRYAPDRLAGLDLGNCAPLAAPLWQAIERCQQVLCDPADRLRYNETLSQRRGEIQSTWIFGPHDRARAEEAHARGQRALLAGEPFKAVSEMAAAARAHGDHPDYEASLAWARYRAELERGKPRAETARAERKVAEEALLGRRPWPRALVALALLCAADEDPDSARWYLREALACDPNLPVARQLLSRLG